jgi:hypothetical protein
MEWIQIRGKNFRMHYLGLGYYFSMRELKLSEQLSSRGLSGTVLPKKRSETKGTKKKNKPREERSC